jgi:hypothetical protein
MRKLSKNSKAVLGAATFLLFAFAGAQVGALHLQQQRFGSSALRSQNLGAHRLPLARLHFTVVKNRRPARGAFADTSLTSYSLNLRFCGLVSSGALTANDPARRSAALPRGPPLS